MSNQTTSPTRWVGQSYRRKEDDRLLTGQGAFMDDLNPISNMHYAAILRSPHAHARIKNIDTSKALAQPGVVTVLTGEDVAAMSRPFIVAAQTKAKYYPCAIDKVRFVGEPVAVVVARNRYQAEDVLPFIEVEYEVLPAVVDPEKALAADAPLLHEETGTNLAVDRTLVYGDPDRAFAEADIIVKDRYRFPKYTSSPLETYAMVANYDRLGKFMTIWSNFHGPFSMHPVLSGALNLPGNRLRLIIPSDIGGAFGIKITIYPYLALIALASMKAGVPVKWIEDRTEALLASSSGTDRITYQELAAKKDGTILGMRMKFIDNVGGYIRAPEPGCLFRPLGNQVGPYKIQHLYIEALASMTNKSLTGPNRGYACQQLYFGTERLVDKLATELKLDPAEVRRINLIEAEQMPYTTPTGGIYDAGDFPGAFEKTLEMADYDGLRRQQEAARKEGRLMGIGIAVGIDPSTSNMGYMDVTHPVEVRGKGRGKSGSAQATSMIMDSTGTVSVELSTTPQGQGHETVIAQVVADELGLHPDDITVIGGMDTATRAWTIPSGAYSSRFAAVAASSAALAARKMKDKIVRIAAQMLEANPDDLELVDGKVRAIGAPDRMVTLKRVAGMAHWDPLSLPEGMEPGLEATYTYTLDTVKQADDQDRVNSSGVYGFGADLIVVEIDPETWQVEIKKYVTMHDTGTILNPAIADGQVYGAAFHGIAGALYEELVYDDNGQMLTGSYMDYLVPTFMEGVTLDIGHHSIPSPVTVLGAKGIGEANSETAPVAIANAVNDALRPLGIEIRELPITPDKLFRWAQKAKESQEVSPS